MRHRFVGQTAPTDVEPSQLVSSSTLGVSSHRPSNSRATKATITTNGNRTATAIPASPTRPMVPMALPAKPAVLVTQLPAPDRHPKHDEDDADSSDRPKFSGPIEFQIARSTCPANLSPGHENRSSLQLPTPPCEFSPTFIESCCHNQPANLATKNSSSVGPTMVSKAASVSESPGKKPSGGTVTRDQWTDCEHTGARRTGSFLTGRLSGAPRRSLLLRAECIYNTMVSDEERKTTVHDGS